MTLILYIQQSGLKTFAKSGKYTLELGHNFFNFFYMQVIEKYVCHLNNSLKRRSC